MVQRRERFLPRIQIIAATICLFVSSQAVLGQNYRLERVASGLDQPTVVTQAPGDPSNILYYATRVTTGGVSASSGTMGSIWRYDTYTRTSTEVMNLSHRGVNLDLGLVGLAFHPDFNNSASPGYQKMYVSTASDNGGGLPINRVEEYAISEPGFKVPVNGSNQPVVNRLILQYNNGFADDNHTIDWIGFNPAEPAQPGNAQRNYLYIATGDGSNGRTADNRPEQKANELLGKVLRIDVGGGDAYPADAQKNFAIPATNPIQLWNSTHVANEQLVGTQITYAGSPTPIVYGPPALPEIYFSGLRNTFGMGFDRQTGDWYGGDVGENSREEVNFMKVNTYDGSQPPRDFGYPKREGTNNGAGNSNFETTLQWNLSGGGNEVVTSVNPIREGPHATLNAASTSATDEVRTTGRSSYIGGSVYRGPITELQGKYVYTDFVHGNVFTLDFDRNTPLANYSGTNFNRAAEPGGTQQVASLGTRTVVANRNVNSSWQSLIVDPSNPNYEPSAGDTNKQFGIGRVVSFGEDNAGNMYIIDFGGNRGDANFGNDYPAHNQGEIFRLMPWVDIRATVDRGTGQITFTNSTGQATSIEGYTVTSAAGAIVSSNLTPVTGRLDSDGSGTIDPTNAWAVTSTPGNANVFEEGATAGSATLSIGESFELSPANGWLKSIYEDVQLYVHLPGGGVALANVDFVGNSGNSYARSDFNFNNDLDAADWEIFKANHNHLAAGLSLAQAYVLGDLDGDRDNDFTDFRLFQADYIAVNGAAAFAALGSSIPEPTGFVLAAIAIFGAGLTRRRAHGRAEQSFDASSRRTIARRLAECSAVTSGALVVLLLTQADAQAQLTLRNRYSFNNPAGAAPSGSTVTDSVDGGDGFPVGTIVGANATFTGSELQLPGGTHANGGAWVNLPNGFASSIHTDSTFEAWYTQTAASNWARIWDFGDMSIDPDGAGALPSARYDINAAGSLTSAANCPNCVAGAAAGNAGDTFFFAPLQGTNINAQRVSIENDFAATLGGVTGNTGGTQNLNSSVATSLDQQVHVVVTYEKNSAGTGQPRITTYMNGVNAGSVLLPLSNAHQLDMLNDVNAWLGKSNYSGDSQLAGRLNEFRVYTGGILSPSQVATHFALGPTFLDPDPLTLEVNTFWGTVTIKNGNAEAFPGIDYYQITSSEGALSPATWNSLDDQNVDASGAGTGESWDEGGGPSANEVTELYLDGATVLGANGTRTLGELFNPAVFGKRVNGDLQFQYALQGGTLIPGDVTYITPPPLVGDYNDDGFVNAADYTVFRNHLGQAFQLPNEAAGVTPGQVTAADYTQWKAHYGESLVLASGEGAQAVPEPTCAWLFTMLGMATISVLRVSRS